MRATGTPQLPFCSCPDPFTHRQGPAAEGLGRGPRQLDMPACHSVACCVCTLHCKGNPTLLTVGHIYNDPAPQSLPCCSVAHRSHLPSLLGPASAGRATVPSAGQLPSSTQRAAAAGDLASRQMPHPSKSCVICTSAALQRQRTAIVNPDAIAEGLMLNVSRNA